MNAAGAERVIRLALRFLDLSRDLDRNLDDSMFKSESDDNEIIYVFDANIFEVFMRPFDSRGQTSSLHGAQWQRWEFPPAKMEAVAAQTCLLATEFLLSGKLPGQKSGRIYLSEWHSWEFARRVRQLVREHGDKLSREVAVDPLNKLTAVLADGPDSPGLGDKLDRLIKQDSLLADDLSDIARNRTFTPAEREAFVLNRSVLKTLAKDKYLEPIEQLARLLGPSIRRRIRVLHTEFLPPPSASAVISRDAKRWLEALELECKARRINVVDDSETTAPEGERYRHRGALRDDARTLAVVRWTATHLQNPGQRVVFVTADTLLFDVYRKWYANLLPRAREYAEPFVMRRLLQYAPIFNLSEATSSLESDVRGFFNRLQNVVEVTLLPINLARQGRSSESQAIITRMREVTALKLLETKPISEELSYQPLRRAIESQPKYSERLENLLVDWRRLERATLGVYDNYIRDRISEKKRVHPELFSGELSESAITTYIDRLISELYSGSLSLWLPFAQEVVSQWRSPRRRRPPRAPIAFRIFLGEDNTIDLGRAVDDRLSGLVTEPLRTELHKIALKDHPAALFGLAASLALASEDWGNADHFAEMALRQPVAIDGAPDTMSDDQLYEFRYLNALTKRFRIGSIGPARTVDALTRIRRALREANALLEGSIEYHQRLDSGRRQTLRLMRALSERAALRLFYAAALTPAVRSTPVFVGRSQENTLRGESGFDIAFAADLRAEAEKCIDCAQADLVECHQLSGRAKIDTRDREAFFRRLRAQYLVNTAASCVLRKLLYPRERIPWTGVPETLLMEVAIESHGWLLEVASKRSQLLAAELFGFLALRGEDAARNALRELQSRRFRSSLSLDVSLFSALTRQLNV